MILIMLSLTFLTTRSHHRPGKNSEVAEPLRLYDAISFSTLFPCLYDIEWNKFILPLYLSFNQIFQANRRTWLKNKVLSVICKKRKGSAMRMENRKFGAYRHYMSKPCETFSCSPDFHDTLLAPLIFVLIALPIHIQYLVFSLLTKISREARNPWDNHFCGLFSAEL